jgi:hypothetical protein
MQHGSLDHPTSYRLKKLGMRNAIEIATEVCVNNFLMASIDQLVDSIHRVQRAAVSPALPGFISTASLSVTPDGPAWLSRVAS